MGTMTFTSDLALRRIEMIQHLLRREDLTVHELCDGIHMTKRWTYAYLAYLHGIGLIHISAYRTMIRADGGLVHTPLYAWGRAQDAQKPTPLTPAERAWRYRNHPELAEFRAARKRALKKKPQRDWAAKWIPSRETL